MNEHDRYAHESMETLDLPDVFGKIDALLGRREGFSPGPKLKSLEEEFPLLTEVVERELEQAAPAPARPVPDRADVQSPGSAAPVSSEPAQNLERVLQDLFIRQQIRLEESIRRIVREELDRHAAHRG